MSDIQVQNQGTYLSNLIRFIQFLAVFARIEENPMASDELVTVDETRIDHAQVLRGLLESQGIRVWLNQESAGAAIGLNLPSILGIVRIIVNAESAPRARELIEAYYAGDLQDDSEDDQG
jgi:hypothetical protein